MKLQQRVDVMYVGRTGQHTRDGIERAMTMHAGEGRILAWARDPDGGNGHVITLSTGDPLRTRTLRETAIAVLMLASAHHGDQRTARRAARQAAARNPES
jgi:hypothetical protein